VKPLNLSPVPAAALGRAAVAAHVVLAAAWLTACNSGQNVQTTRDGETTAVTPAPAPAPQPPPADTGRPDPQAWPARAVLEENSLAVSTYGPDDPLLCGLPAVQPGDGRSTVLVFHGCAPQSGPALDAVPARRVSVPAGTDPMEAAVRAQLAGATQEEKSRGYVSNFGPGTEATGFTVRRMDGGLVVLDLHPSVRSQRMVFVSNAEARQLVAALGQFPGVQRVAILIGGQPLCRALGQC
jgi:hypothetical protein